MPRARRSSALLTRSRACAAMMAFEMSAFMKRTMRSMGDSRSRKPAPPEDGSERRCIRPDRRQVDHSGQVSCLGLYKTATSLMEDWYSDEFVSNHLLLSNVTPIQEYQWWVDVEVYNQWLAIAGDLVMERLCNIEQISINNYPHTVLNDAGDWRQQLVWYFHGMDVAGRRSRASLGHIEVAALRQRNFLEVLQLVVIQSAVCVTESLIRDKSSKGGVAHIDHLDHDPAKFIVVKRGLIATGDELGSLAVVKQCLAEKCGIQAKIEPELHDASESKRIHGEHEQTSWAAVARQQAAKQAAMEVSGSVTAVAYVDDVLRFGDIEEVN